MVSVECYKNAHTQQRGSHSCEVRKITLTRYFDVFPPQFFFVSKIVQIENKEEEEVKEEIVTQAMTTQLFESDCKLKLNRNGDHSWKIRN